jgi:hypothetical protein
MVIADVKGLRKRSQSQFKMTDRATLTSRFGQFSSIVETRDRFGVLVAP